MPRDCIGGPLAAAPQMGNDIFSPLRWVTGVSNSNNTVVVILLSTSQKKLEFTGLLSQSHQRLFAYVHSLVKDLNDADDIIQRTSLILWEKFESYDRRLSFFAWAAGVARLEVLNFIRKRGREKLCFSEDVATLLAQSTEAQASDLEAQSAALSDCLQKLTVDQRELINSCYLQDSSVEEVARSRQRSTHSVYNSLRRLRRLLLECVQRALFDDGELSPGSAP